MAGFKSGSVLIFIGFVFLSVFYLGLAKPEDKKGEDALQKLFTGLNESGGSIGFTEHGSHSNSNQGPGSYSYSWSTRQKRGICLFGLFFCGGEGGEGGAGGDAPGAPGGRF